MIVPYNQDLSRNDLVIYIRNDDGAFLDPFSVVYTIIDGQGSEHSGKDLPALRQGPGTYYAPLRTQMPNGAHLVKWSIKYSAESSSKTVLQNMFNLDPGTYAKLNAKTTPAKFRPPPSSKTFITGYSTGPDDLAIYFTDLSGVRFDPYSVFCSIREKSGHIIVKRQAAQRASVGHFWVPYTATAKTGDFTVFWEYNRQPDDPLQSSLLPFSQLNPGNTGITTNGDSNCDCDYGCDKAITGCSCECTKYHASFAPPDC